VLPEECINFLTPRRELNIEKVPPPSKKNRWHNPRKDCLVNKRKLHPLQGKMEQEESYLND